MGVYVMLSTHQAYQILIILQTHYPQFFLCMSIDHCTVPVIVFLFLQAIGDGGQGWGNAILYIFFSPVIRSRLFKEPCEDCFEAIQEKFQRLCESDSDHRQAMYGERRKTDTSPLIIATEARGYKIQEYHDTNITSTSAGGGGSSVGMMSKSDRHGLFRPPLAKNPKLINSQ